MRLHYSRDEGNALRLEMVVHHMVVELLFDPLGIDRHAIGRHADQDCDLVPPAITTSLHGRQQCRDALRPRSDPTSREARWRCDVDASVQATRLVWW